MADFTLDTSGAVGPLDAFGHIGMNWWHDLDPFTQGYVEAAFASQGGLYWAGAKGGERMTRGFRDLAPETLAMILRDCEAFRKPTRGVYGASAGRSFWAMRQSQLPPPGFPPLTAYLGDDGKVYLREADNG